MSKLLKCPCGKTPKSLAIYEVRDNPKLAYVSGNCCGDWEIEFRSQYFDTISDECMSLAIEAWNKASRGAFNDNT